MARKNMWSATAAVGDSELRGILEGYAPERDGTVELTRTTGNSSQGVYSVGRLGGAHRRNERPSGLSPSGRKNTTSVVGRANVSEWTSVWPEDSEQTVSRASVAPSRADAPPPRTEYGRGQPDHTRPEYGRPEYPPGPADYPPGRAGDTPTHVGAGGGRGSKGRRRSPSRPLRYTGSRRKFSSWAPLAGGVLMLVLVLGATMLAEADRYTGSSSSALNGSQSTVATPTTAGRSTGATASRSSRVADSPAAEAVATALNKEFDVLGCGRVDVDQSLVTAAGAHVNDMISKGYLDTGAPDGSATMDRAKTAGYQGTKVAESVISGAGNPAEAARVAFPTPEADLTVPATVKVVSGGPLTCGWTAVGAEAKLNSRGVGYWSIVLGQ